MNYFTIAKYVAGAVLVILLVWLVLWWAGAPARKRAAEAESAARTSSGQAAAGANAVGVVGGNSASSQALDTQQRETENEIRAAPPGDNGVALRRLCLSASYRDQPACKQLLQPSPR